MLLLLAGVYAYKSGYMIYTFYPKRVSTLLEHPWLAELGYAYSYDGASFNPEVCQHVPVSKGLDIEHMSASASVDPTFGRYRRSN